MRRFEAGAIDMRGFTLIELMVTIGILAILLGVAVFSMRGLDNPLNDATQQVAAVLKQTRLKAMANTGAYLIKPASITQLTAAYADSCSSASWTNDPALARTLPKGIVFSSTAWNVCFNSRGLASSSPNIDLVRQKDNKTVQIQVLLGGAVVQP